MLTHWSSVINFCSICRQPLPVRVHRVLGVHRARGHALLVLRLQRQGVLLRERGGGPAGGHPAEEGKAGLVRAEGRGQRQGRGCPKRGVVVARGHSGEVVGAVRVWRISGGRGNCTGF
ncbi:hypothetical protein CEXT_503891 [Caerostris extrusa]|uniref:Uncharacterized protein n=1 Tax=Caerostris extrusa TaxID=172846 RepID=A0AAV4PSU9_CAEEX|nr:hypothetical protein CEXT_503891 [Caerostris extrusa]